MSKFDRRSFLKSAGIATGVAVVGGVPAAAAAAVDDRLEVVATPSALSHETLFAYVRDAQKGEVTIVSGFKETTFRDKTLAKRIQKAAASHTSSSKRGAI